MNKESKIPISILVHTLNEEKNIRNCLESIKWADEIVIVDMYSDDKTVTIAEEYTDKIFFHERMRYADPARQFGLGKATNEWVFQLDADELVPLILRDKLIQIIEDDSADIVSVPRNNYFFGHLMENAGWGSLQDSHHRFFKKDFVFITPNIHSSHIEREDARYYEIKDPKVGVIHFNYIDVEHFMEKLDRYTTIEAENLYESNDDIRFRSIINQIYNEFKNRYLNQGGRKEGFRGFGLSFLMATYRVVTYMKLKLMKEYDSKNPREKIIDKYQKLADDIILEYNK